MDYISNNIVSPAGAFLTTQWHNAGTFFANNAHNAKLYIQNFQITRINSAATAIFLVAGIACWKCLDSEVEAIEKSTSNKYSEVALTKSFQTISSAVHFGLAYFAANYAISTFISASVALSLWGLVALTIASVALRYFVKIRKAELPITPVSLLPTTNPSSDSSVPTKPAAISPNAPPLTTAHVTTKSTNHKNNKNNKNNTKLQKPLQASITKTPSSSSSSGSSSSSFSSSSSSSSSSGSTLSSNSSGSTLSSNSSGSTLSSSPLSSDSSLEILDLTPPRRLQIYPNEQEVVQEEEHKEEQHSLAQLSQAQT